MPEVDIPEINILRKKFIDDLTLKHAKLIEDIQKEINKLRDKEPKP